MFVATARVKSYCCAAHCKEKTCFLLSWKPTEITVAKMPPHKAVLLEAIKNFQLHVLPMPAVARVLT